MEVCDKAPEPKIENPTDVLLAVEAVGVCGSDMHYYKDGRIGCQIVEYPWIVGHECSGRVLEVGVGEMLEPVRVAVNIRVAITHHIA